MIFRLGTGAGSTFDFVPGSSGLSLGNAMFSDNNGVSWGYAPSPEAEGRPQGTTATSPTGRSPMTGTVNAMQSAPYPSFTMKVQVE